MCSFVRLLKFSAVCLPFALGACSDRWEIVYSKDVFPYGNARTAGSGVLYVLENIMPAKSLNVEPVSELVQPVFKSVDSAPLEKSFNEVQKK